MYAKNNPISKIINITVLNYFNFKSDDNLVQFKSY